MTSSHEETMDAGAQRSEQPFELVTGWYTESSENT